MQGFRFILRQDVTRRVKCQFMTQNPDQTRTPINLERKNVSVSFRQRDAKTDLLALDSSQPANQFGAKVTITDAVAGRFEIYVPATQIAEYAVGIYGEYEILLHEPDGDVRELASGQFSVRAK